ncbi:ATP-dependent RNA helicase DHX33 [Chionoecetes opilio]|uniref:ATP-dependent RNA helicase DHX33 n=1 Tax=Chionoecetes opilio TaxID=41210 RepID=A0A8J4YV20_CHIOP|nr:ATP-dependent RNA helicase DHX33 [Chionoecetes opilio]
MFQAVQCFPDLCEADGIFTPVKKTQKCVFMAGTGSGKEIRGPIFFLQEGVAAGGAGGGTQPRKIAATSLATHVAMEMGSEVGRLVGYKVGMQARKTDSTRILYMTDHVLLNECLQDNALARYSCIIIARDKTQLKTGPTNGELRKMPKAGP